MFQCGAAQTDITPWLGTDIPGQFYNRLSTGVKDPLFAKAVVFDDGNQRFVSVVLDVIVIDAKAVASIRKKAAAMCAVNPSGIMVSATHTHTGAPVGDLYSSKKNSEYMEFLTRRAADAIAMAVDNLQPAKIGADYGHEDDIAYQRRFRMKDGTYRTNPPVASPELDKPLGPIDPKITVVRIDDVHDCPIAVLSNFACHLDVVGGTENSADYPGEIARTVAKNLGDHVISIFYTGTCGNINHVNFTRQNGKPSASGYPYSRYMGRVLGHEVLRTREKIITGAQCSVRHASATLSIDRRKVDPAALKEAYEKVAKDERSDSSLYTELIHYHEHFQEPAEAEMQVASIGDIALAGFPGEIFVEFGLDLKKRSPFAFNITAELTNGSLGYIPVPEAFGQGGYEPSLTSYTNAVPEAGEQMTDALISLLEKISKPDDNE